MEKKTKRSFKVPSDHFDYLLFNSSWCPITGDLPFNGTRYAEAQTINRCMDIIQGARTLLNPNNITEAQSFFDNWEDRIYPFFNLILDDSLKIYELLPEKFSEYIDKYWGRRRKTLQSHEYFALIAIIEAWEILRKIRCDGKIEDDPNLSKRSLVALEVFHRASDDYLRSKVVKFSNTQSKKAKKYRSRNGLTPIEIKTRNDKIRDHFKNTNLTPSSFATKHTETYGLSTKQIRNILKISVGN